MCRSAVEKLEALSADLYRTREALSEARKELEAERSKVKRLEEFLSPPVIDTSRMKLESEKDHA